MKKTGARPSNVDDYIAAAAPDARPKLTELRACIREAAPAAKEELKWGHPAYSARRILVLFAVHRKHIGFHPTPSAIAAFAQQLSRYQTSTGTIQFPLDHPLPLPLIRKITKFRVREEQEKDAKWKP